MTVKGLKDIKRKVTILKDLLEELKDEVSDKEEALEDKASERESGEMTEKEEEKHDALETFFYEIDDVYDDLEEFECAIEDFEAE